MVFLLHVGRLPLTIGRIVSRNRILCEAAFMICSVVWASPEPHGHQGSTPSFIDVVIPEASDSRSEVVQFTPRRAAEPKVGVSHFGCCKGMRWNSWLLPLLEPLILSPLRDRLMLRKRLHQFNRRLCKRPSRFETRSCFQAYRVIIEIFHQRGFGGWRQGDSEGGGISSDWSCSNVCKASIASVLVLDIQ